MTLARTVTAIVAALQAVLALAIARGMWPQWTAILALVGVGIQAFTTSIGWSSAQTAAAVTAARLTKLQARAPRPPIPPVISLLALTLVGCNGCAWMKGPAPVQTAGLAVADVMCILDHDEEPPAQIVVDCRLASDAGKIIEQILTSSHAAEARYAAKVGRPDAGAGK